VNGYWKFASEFASFATKAGAGGAVLVAVKLATERSLLLLEEFSNPRLLRGFTRSLGGAGESTQLFDADLVGSSRWLDAYAQRGHGAGLDIIHPRVTPELVHCQRRCFVQRLRRHLDGVPNTS
jgi:hypothetical protein